MKFSKKHLVKIVSCLRNGGVICFPTETVYSLSCDASNKDAINKIYKIKNRPINKQFAVLMSDIEMARCYVEINERANNLINKYSPGAVSYVLPLKDGSSISKNIIKDGTLAVRIPDHDIAQCILNAYGRPLVGTSVNFSSQKSACSIKEIPEEIKSKVDIVIDDVEEKISGISSTLIDLSHDNIKILRQGEINVICSENTGKV